MRTRPGELQTYLKSVAQTTTEGCIVWPYGTSQGYGSVRFRGRHMNASRAVLILATGQDPRELESSHGPCHNRLCVNPRHLKWVARTENQRDRARDNTVTMIQGEQHPSTHLTDEEVRKLRKRYQEDDIRQIALAADYGIAQSSVSRIIKHQTWKHLE